MYKCYPVDYISITGGYNQNHQAVDFGWWGNTSDRPIYSVSDGKVLEVRNNYKTKDATGNSYGNYILIENEDGSRSTYCHLKYASCLVNVGDKVKQHQHIGTMGETGRAGGPHLHYEHRINGVKVNPFDHLYCFPDFQTINYEKPDAKYIKMKPEEPEPQNFKYNVGEKMILNGHLYANSNGEGKGKMMHDCKCTIMLRHEGVKPYNVDTTGDGSYDGWVDERNLKPYEEPKKEIEIGTRVRTIGTGKETSYGEGNDAKSGIEGTITNIIEGRPYPYLVNQDGWYKKEDLEII